MKIEKRIALVTGGSRGIGRAIAVKLSEAGTCIFVNYLKNRKAASETLRIIRDKGGNGELCPFDVSNLEATQEAIKNIIEQKGRIDILVNNAAVSISGIILRAKENDWDTTININLKGTFNCCKSVSKYMVKQRWGRIVNISSVVAEGGNPGQVCYSASKAGVLGITKSLAKELGARNICVNAVAPGFIETDMTASLSGESKDKIIDCIPLSRIGTPDDIAGVVTFLVSESANYITGQTINVCGGLYI